MAQIPESHADLLGAPHFAHLCTINADGSPQTSPVWVTRDGNDILLNSAEGRRKNSAEGRRKVANLRRNPAVALSVHDQSNPYRYLEVRGRAEVSALPPEQNWDFLDGLAKEYMGVDQYPNKSPDLQRVVIRVSVDHVATMG